MLDFLVVLSTFGIAGMIIGLIVAAFTRRNKLGFVLGLLMFLIIFAVSVALYPIEDPYDYAEYAEYVD